jgi:hypothetical protein
LGQPARAARLLGAREALDRTTGYAHPSGSQDELLASLRESLGNDALEAALEEGRSYPLESVLDDEVVWNSSAAGNTSSPRQQNAPG